MLVVHPDVVGKQDFSNEPVSLVSVSFGNPTMFGPATQFNQRPKDRWNGDGIHGQQPKVPRQTQGHVKRRPPERDAQPLCFTARKETLK